MACNSKSLRVFEYINNLISLLENPDDFNKCDFTLLCEKYPIINKSSFIAKVLYISLQTPDKTIRFYPDKIKEMGFEHIVLTSNTRRRINCNSLEFFVNGNTEKQVYKEHEYYNYSIERINKTNRDMLLKLREKYDIPEPTIFKGTHQNIVLD